MSTTSTSTVESTSSSISTTITIPNIDSVVSITLNTGTATFSLSGTELTINCSNGSPIRYDSYSYTPQKYVNFTRRSSSYNTQSSYYYNDGTYSGYIPVTVQCYLESGSEGYYDSYTAYDSQTATKTDNYRWNGSSWGSVTSTSYSPSSMSYWNNGYTGNLTPYSWNGPEPNYPATPSPKPATGTTTSRSASGTLTYYGTVGKTVPSTAVYREDYAGTVYAATQSGSTAIYKYTITVTYNARIKVGTTKIAKGGGTVLVLPLYDQNIDMSGINQLRSKTNTRVAAYELVSTSHTKASPLRIMTPSGVKSVRRE